VKKKLEYFEDSSVLKSKSDFSIKTQVKITSEENLDWLRKVNFDPTEIALKESISKLLDYYIYPPPKFTDKLFCVNFDLKKEVR